MTGSGSENGSAPGLDAGVIAALAELGFSQYEARTYAGLIGREPMTGYAIAKDTLVPQPKVYETLGRLVERGAVQQVSGSPAKFVAIPRPGAERAGEDLPSAPGHRRAGGLADATRGRR